MRALLSALALLLTACAATLPPSRQAPPPAIPPLPANARQPMPPPVCSPTCSDGLRIELSSWQALPTPPAPPARPASGPTTR